MINTNCDVGEGKDNEHLLMPYIASCNIACGGHAGNRDTMTKVVDYAIKHQVKIGAHPSYPDKENFGRQSVALSSTELSDTLNEQINALEVVVKMFSTAINHIKPHGVLYNDLAVSESLAHSFLNAIEKYREKYVLYVPYGSAIAKIALERQFGIVYEAFADRNYTDDLTLVPRNQPQSVLTDSHQIIKHIERIRAGKVKSITGKCIPIQADSYCVHADTDNAPKIVKDIYEAFSNI